MQDSRPPSRQCFVERHRYAVARVRTSAFRTPNRNGPVLGPFIEREGSSGMRLDSEFAENGLRYE
jgi:hypothetical protein